MSIFADDFESYTLGAQPPFPNWIVAPAATANTKIDAGGPSPSTKFLNVRLNDVIHEDPSPLSNFSVFFHYSIGGTGFFFRLVNGVYPYSSSSTGVTLLTFQVEQDSSISVISGANVFIGNTLVPHGFNGWPYLQLNVTLDTVTLLGVDYVRARVVIAVDGVQWMDKTANTMVTVGSLPTLMPEVNRFLLSASLTSVGFDNFSYDTAQSIPSFPASGSPKGRFTQGLIESLNLPDSGKVRFTQGEIESLLLPNTAKVRFSQGVIELIYGIGSVPGSGGWQIHES